MDMKKPGAYFEDARDYCKAMIDQIEREIMTLEAKKTVYYDLQWKLDTAIHKEDQKAAGEIEY